MKAICSTLRNGISDIDDKLGIVKFYFANFETPDSNNRLMDGKAFNRTFNNNFDRYQHLLNHNPNIILGKPQEVGTDNHGAWMVSKLSMATAGRDAMIQYAEKIYDEHSFMFRIVKSHMNGETEVVEELQMYEASTVTWGVHKDTNTISLNSFNEDIIIKKLDQILGLGISHTDSSKSVIEFINNFNFKT